MLDRWRQEYTTLIDFLSAHPEIKIQTSVIRIPEDVRTEFYQLFLNTREAFLNEKNITLITKAEELSKEYSLIEDELIKLLSLENIDLLLQENNFLHNPRNVLITQQRSLLYDLLKGKIDIRQYEEEASNILISSFNSYYQHGYEIWMVLSLIKLLEADKLYRVEADEFDDYDEYFKHRSLTEVVVPKPQLLSVLSFKRSPITSLLAADQIVHSAKIGQYISFRRHIVEPENEAMNKSEQREWIRFPKKTLTDMDSNVIFVYSDKALTNLSLIADSNTICRPDLIITCVGLKSSFNDNDLIKTRKYSEYFKPKLGTYVISNKPVIEEKIQERKATLVSSESETQSLPQDKKTDIYFMPIGFDQSKLEQIMDLFITEESHTKFE